MLVSGGFFTNLIWTPDKHGLVSTPSYAEGRGCGPSVTGAFATLFHPGWIRESFSPKTQPINMGALNATT
ncbi:hypothetical protein KAM361_10140 [Aeromonas caviae]|nr:hypothetical protein KAM335_19590 [Aeromonas caviae]GJB06341.1 hypothetical protein KAM361_10140 [Aeromonas caviae]